MLKIEKETLQREASARFLSFLVGLLFSSSHIVANISQFRVWPSTLP
jgi:hypothetical protein